ncbi:hypothetical protein [Humisphaera borealis]|uniref:Cohesin domain-containing protein n=1 Tax=Humisphaera borealis TaxID=2807512 RepID=A0A7M2WQM7_9BACT|nr:hypothetical protein [Humisphaera borealis]QOV87837.1 hypothetical protein IPV69_16280 [Humisphaera borealis]
MSRAFHATLSAIVCSLILASPAAAGLISPGETVSLSSGDFGGPVGIKLAEKSSPFVIDYGADPVFGFDGKLNGTLHSAVYNVGGKLAFFYDVDLDSNNFVSGATEQSELTVLSFAGFATTVSGMLDYEEAIKASRSVDGAQIVLFSDTPGLGGPPALLVQTDATSYSESGSAVFHAGDELLTLNATKAVIGSTTIEGAFQPTIGGGSGQVPPTAIPLPPAAYSGLGVLMAMAIIVAVRRTWNTQQC